MELIDLLNNKNSTQIKVEISLPDLERFADKLIKQYKKVEESPLSKPDIGRIDLAMEITGLTKSTIYSKVSKGEIPVMKRAGILYFSRKMLEKWILDSRVATKKEIHDNASSYIR